MKSFKVIAICLGVLFLLAYAFIFFFNPFWSPQLPRGFEFNMSYDDQHATILDYRFSGEKEDFSEEKTIIAAPSPDFADTGRGTYGNGLGYQYIRPTNLYVKWQDDLTHEIYSKDIDLRQVLPKNIDGTDLYFNIFGSQIFVYLALKEPKVNRQTNVGTMFQERVNIQLYPISLNK
ncbi:hypothetical protein [Sapientia aquatica]|uniref:Uncharacterized protein n=1 Tax=Sapientia aquatica TaxID=1549640 RepID=A0A4R5W479_9BURK|nr:hypothetical protein [Sapientia aquatica]TDK67559.1 hypothetical protein E2I14_07370 [Sapientia aquatica]